MESVPQHVAIIMDGNGRWANAHRHPRVYGHIKGAKVARQIIESCTERGVKFLTLFAFSTENWKRPVEEVAVLMKLLSRHLIRERTTLMKNGIRFTTIGQTDRLPSSVRAELDKTISETSQNTGMVLTFALSYGGRQDLTQAVQSIAEDIKAGRLAPEDVDECTISRKLWTSGLPDPDLVIRTSGEQRVSNFLLWQGAYSEFVFTSINWPDFSEKHLLEAFHSFSHRERRFGDIQAPRVGQIFETGSLQ